MAGKDGSGRRKLAQKRLEEYCVAGYRKAIQVLEEVGEPHKAALWFNRSGAGVADLVKVDGNCLEVEDLEGPQSLQMVW